MKSPSAGSKAYDEKTTVFSASCLALSLVAAPADFLPSGKMALGVNYWASDTATEMWRKWNPQVVEEDLRILAENGLTTVRVFPNWADFQPIHAVFRSAGACDTVWETRMFDTEDPLPDTPCGRAGVDERMVERFEAFCDLAEKHGIRLVVPLLTGQMTFRNLIPPALAHLNPFSDPYALAWEGRYLECLVTRLKAKKAIVAWEAGNEAQWLGRSESAFRFETWLRYVVQTIRCADPSRPVIGVDGLNIDKRGICPTAVNAALTDCVTTHPYGFWGAVYNDDFRTVRSVTFAAAQTYALEQIAGKPAFIEEHGSRRQEQASRANVADYMRAMLWNAWAADAKGMLWWCAFDQTGMTIAPYNWSNPCLELGLFKRDRTPYPALKPLRDFAKLQKALPFSALPKAKTDAVVLTMDADVVHSAYILARQAGFFPRFASPEGRIPEADTYFIPAAHGRAGFTTENWEFVKAKVRAGATLYLSWSDTFLDEMETVGGVEVAYRDKEKTILAPTTAEILEKDSDGNGFLFRNRCGQGTVYVCRRPFEKTLYQGTGGYEGDSWKIWARVRPVARILKTDSPNVFVSEHRLGDGRVALLVVNNSRTPYRGPATLASGWRVTSVLTDDPEKAKWTDGRLDLASCSGILLMICSTSHISSSSENVIAPQKSLAVTWAELLRPPADYAAFAREVKPVAKYACADFDVEVYSQANGPGTRQRVMMAVPRALKGKAPCVVVPFYYPEAMLGFDPSDGSRASKYAPPGTNLAFYAAIGYMADLTRRGYITLSADAYHLTYATQDAPENPWLKWQHASAALNRDWPDWSGVGKLVFDTRLLVDLAAADPRVDATRIGMIGHSLGGKMAYLAGLADPRVRVVVASDFGLGWTQTNWGDAWYWCGKLAGLRAQGLSNVDLLEQSGGKPLCLIAGEYDDADSGRLLRSAKGYEAHPERLLVIRHGTGHRPPRAATEEGYRFLDGYLKESRTAR